MNHPYVKKPRVARPSAGWTIPDLCAAYDWPTDLSGAGVIALIELGGGWIQTDVDIAFGAMMLPAPAIVDVSVDGTVNKPGGDADGEVALDIQVAAAAYSMATGQSAQIRIYWCQDIATGVQAAADDGCAVCSISWGSDEANWGQDAADTMEKTAERATSRGMVIFAASGDNDSQDGGDTPANVDLPASCPHIVGCGGTMRPEVGMEEVWNNNPGQSNGEGTGGGFSTMFPTQSWQDNNTPGRMVPDVAANADPDTGYHIILNNEPTMMGGTSAVAPLYAGLFAAFPKLAGNAGPVLFQHAECFNDITVGNNGMFTASIGPDPCTGLGSPKASKIAALFA
jgi:kumamolisin